MRPALAAALLVVVPLLAAAVPAAGDITLPTVPDHVYPLVMRGTTFDAMEFPNTPLLEAYLGETVQFTIIVPPDAEPHTFHLHGHPWQLTDGSIIDTILLEPGDTHTFTVTAGGVDLQPGDWMYHCHFESHFAAGMWGIFRVYPYAMNVTGIGPTFDVTLAHLGAPVDGATLTATLDGAPVALHALALGDGRYQLHTALAPTTKGVLVVTAHGALGDSVERVGLGGASVPAPSVASAAAEQGAPAPVAHAH